MENCPLRTLKGSDLHRYQEKLRIILEVPENVNLLDFCPYSSKKLHWETLDLKKWPPLHYDNVCDFLLNTPGPYSTTMPSARRSLREGLDFFRSGHVAEVQFAFSPEKKNVIAKSQVKSSQGQQKYASWVGFKHTTLPTVIGAHCTCMAGTGESCCHIGALLYKINAATALLLNENSCTDVLAYWSKLPASKVSPSPVSKINFTKSKNLTEQALREPKKSKSVHLQEISRAELLKDLQDLNPNASILKIIPSTQQLNKTMLQILDETITKSINLYGLDLLNEVSITEEDASRIEKDTRLQNNSPLWFEQRRWRITASIAGKILNRKKSMHPTTHINSIINRGNNLENVPSIKYGIVNEQKARSLYIQTTAKNHFGFRLRCSGLCISPEYPYIGASPDGIVTCDCHGITALEIKCPFSLRNLEANEAAKKMDCCLVINDTLSLKTTHPYYHQVQIQMELSRAASCDFVIFTLPNSQANIHVITVAKNLNYKKQFFNQLKTFYSEFILPKAIEKLSA